MCGRVVQTPSAFHRLKLAQEVGPLPYDFKGSYNLAPTSPLLVLRNAPGRPDLALMRWGLVPSWWKDAAKLPTQTFNARAETVAEKPTFRTAFRRRRCIVPVDGFYEWMTVAGKKTKQPMYIHPKDREGVFVLAGLWDTWETADGAMESCTIITTEPNDLMAEIHNRMPVILPPAAVGVWLDSSNEDMKSLESLLAPVNSMGMDAYPVSPVRGEGPALIAKA